MSLRGSQVSWIPQLAHDATDSPSGSYFVILFQLALHLTTLLFILNFLLLDVFTYLMHVDVSLNYSLSCVFSKFSLTNHLESRMERSFDARFNVQVDHLVRR